MASSQIKKSVRGAIVAAALLLLPLVSTTTQASGFSCSAVFSGQPAAASPLYNDFLKQPLLERDHKDRMSDLLSQRDFSKIVKTKVKNEMPQSERVKALRKLNLASIVAAPGHRKLRNPKQVMGLKEYILSSNGGDFAHDPILINVITDAQGTVKSVDLWNAHHRLVAYLLAGYQKIGDVPSGNIAILVNGVTVTGEKWGHYLPIGGIDSSATKDYTAIPAGGEIRVGTVSVDGTRSNFELGSRNSIGQLLKNTMENRTTKVGVYFGTFDPVHEGHIAVAKSIMEKYQLDEVVMVPNIDSLNKPNATKPEHRLEMMRIRVSKEKNLNLYTGPSEVIVNQFGRDPLFERITQTYGTSEIYQIIGSDSFKSSLEANSISEKSNRRFIVNPREISETIHVPENMKDMVRVSDVVGPVGLSSTKIRNQIKNNETPSSSILDGDVFSYLRRFLLYQ